MEINKDQIEKRIEVLDAERELLAAKLEFAEEGVVWEKELGPIGQALDSAVKEFKENPVGVLPLLILRGTIQ